MGQHVRVDPSMLAGGRFTLLRSLGGGGFGEVSAAYDRDVGTDVAIKRLRHVDIESLMAFRREFRTLATLSHPNLVRLGELFEDEGRWFFSMELIQGTSLFSWVRSGDNDPGFVVTRLVRALVQLTHGLMAVHSAGYLHRDVKPANVLVAEGERVVLLDFGLARSLSRFDPEESGMAIGTPAYMAPEQIDPAPLTPAADFYALGVLLYEMLTGEVPFEGGGMEVLLRKQHELPKPPSTRVARVPPVLDDLCMRLLQIDPSDRPSGAEVLRMLGADQRALRSSSIPPPAFVGRRRELAVLDRCLARAREGLTTLVFVEGEAGIGKTALIEHFLSQSVASGGEWLVLGGRCYERELVSYKAFEGIADALVGYLRALPLARVEALLPRDASLLLRPFPAFAKVPLLSVVDQPASLADPAELRTRVITVLTELVRRVASERPLLLWVDDLHWADTDSLRLLLALSCAVTDLPVLFLACARKLPELSAAGLASSALPWAQGASTRLRLRGLSLSDARELARCVAGEAENERDTNFALRGAEGHPMLLSELLATPALDLDGSSRELALRHILEPRIRALSTPARELLELVALFGVPCRAVVLAQALESKESFTGILHELRAARFVKSQEGLLECAHDQIRSVVSDRLDPSLRMRRHARLAQALERFAEKDAAQLGEAWLRARDPLRAVPHLIEAARGAAALLAFDRAARLFGQVLSVADGVLSSPEITALRVERGHVLAQAGRGVAAAEEYLRAAEESTANEALDLRRRAAHHFLRAGEVQKGIALTSELLLRAGVRLADTVPRAFSSILFQRARVVVARTFAGARSRPVEAEEMARLGLLWSVAPALNTIDYLRGAELQAQYVRAAEASGSREHLIQALTMEAVYRAAVHASGYESLLARCDELVREGASAYHEGLLEQCRGTVAFLDTRYLEAREHLQAAEQTLRMRCHDVAWELAYTRGNLLCSLTLLGEYRELFTLSRAWLRDAADRGNVFARMYVSTVGMGAVSHLLADQPEAGEEELDACFGAFSQLASTWALDSFQGPHVGELFARTLLRLYRGGEVADRFLDSRWPQAKRSAVMRGQAAQANLLQLRARATLSTAKVKRADERARALADVRATLRGLRKNSTALGQAFADDLEGQLAWIEGREEEAQVLLTCALGRYEALGIRSWAEPTRFLLGRVLGGEEGRGLRERALGWAEQQGFVAPERYLVTFAPGSDGY